MTERFVVDASVVVALFVKERSSDAALRFFDALSRPDVVFHVPDAVYYEVAGALRGLEQRGLFDGAEAALRLLLDLNLTHTACRDLAREAIRLSRTHVVSPYDAFYLALAVQIGAPLITVDRRLLGAVAGKGFDVRHVAAVVAG